MLACPPTDCCFPAPGLVCPAPLSVLLVLGDSPADVAVMLEGMRGHFALSCQGAAQALEAAEAFEPDVVLIDRSLPGVAEFQQRLSALLNRGGLTFVALASSDDQTDAPLLASDGFEYEFAPTTAMCELEQLLWRINLQREADRQLDLPAENVTPGEMTG